MTSQVYELAWFLHQNARNDEFWKDWTELHDGELRTLESVSFLLAENWFQCDLPEAVQTEIERLPVGTRRWFETHATCPSPMGWLRPTKDGVWLHSSLLKSNAEKRQVVLSRLLPRRLLPVDAAIANHTPNIYPGDESISRNYNRYLAYLFGRVAYNAWVIPYTLWHGFRWWLSARS